jgi:hypothetical protein
MEAPGISLTSNESAWRFAWKTEKSFIVKASIHFRVGVVKTTVVNTGWFLPVFTSK